MSNHDEDRTISVLGTDKMKARIAAAIMLTVSGSPYLYYGEELGMLGMKGNDDKNVREPFLWSNFSTDIYRAKWFTPANSTDNTVKPLNQQMTDYESLYRIDLFDRKLIGWSISDNMSASKTVIPAIRMANRNRSFTKDMIFHSDRGTQYACKQTVNILKSLNTKQSMSRKGNCWDNAVAESFFKSFKTELICSDVSWSSCLQELHQPIFQSYCW